MTYFKTQQKPIQRKAITQYKMDNVDDIYNALLEYEEEINLQDPSAPEEGEDISLTPEELEYLEKDGDKLPPLPEGKSMSQSMLNFA